MHQLHLTAPLLKCIFKLHYIVGKNYTNYSFKSHLGYNYFQVISVLTLSLPINDDDIFVFLSEKCILSKKRRQKAKMWHGREKCYGLWPPAFPAPTITVSNSTRNLDDRNVANLCKIS